MKLSNLPLALLVLIAALFILTAVGFGIGHLFDFELTLNNVTHPSEFLWFFARTIVGITVLGYLTGIWKLLDLFALCLTHKGG